MMKILSQDIKVMTSGPFTAAHLELKSGLEPIDGGAPAARRRLRI